MIDLRLVREDPDLVRASQRLRGESVELVDALLRADEDRRAATQRFEAVRAEQKSLGKQVARAAGAERDALLARTKHSPPSGRDVRGILRGHQFDKVEMFSFCGPEQARDEHRRLLAMQEEMLAKVEVPYRVIDVAAGDLGSSATRKFDCARTRSLTQSPLPGYRKT